MNEVLPYIEGTGGGAVLTTVGIWAYNKFIAPLLKSLKENREKEHQEDKDEIKEGREEIKELREKNEKHLETIADLKAKVAYMKGKFVDKHEHKSHGKPTREEGEEDI